MLELGAAEIAFLIPRDIFKNHLGPLARQLTFINKLLGDLGEIIEGHAAQVEVRDLSSSIPTIALAASLPVMYTIAKIVEKFLDAWKKVEEIREIRESVRRVGVTGAAYNEFTEKIKSTVKEVVDQEISFLTSTTSVGQVVPMNLLLP